MKRDKHAVVRDRPSLHGVTLKVGESIDIIFEQAIVEIGLKGVTDPKMTVTIQKVKSPDGFDTLSMRFGPVH